MIRSSAFDIKTAHSISEIDADDWNRLSDGKPFQSHAWYRLGETVLTGSIPFYVVISQNGEPVARAAFWLVRNDQLPLASPLLRAGVSAAISRWPLLVCRSPLADDSGLILPDEPTLRAEALHAIFAAARKWASGYWVSFILFDYLEASLYRISDWPADMVRSPVDGSGMRLAITWATFQEYVSSMPTGVRKDYRRHGNRASDLGITINVEDPSASLEQALPLIRAVEDRHGVGHKPWARSLMQHVAIQQALEPNATWLAARTAGRLVGCGLLLEDGGVQLATLIGLDESVQYVYFQLFYAAIRVAIQRGSRALRAGSGAYEFKARLGFLPESNNHVAFYGRGPLLRGVTRLAASAGWGGAD